MSSRGWPLHRLSEQQFAALRLTLDRLAAEELERGAKLCDEEDLSPDGMRDAQAVIEYWDSEREMVARCGECTGGCAARKIVEFGGRKDPVCRQTGEACISFRLTNSERALT